MSRNRRYPPEIREKALQRRSGKRWRRPASAAPHDPGIVLRDLAVAVADSGDQSVTSVCCGGQQALFGPVASESTAHRAIKSIDAVALETTGAVSAKALKREPGMRAPRPKTITLDIDASLLTAHSVHRPILARAHIGGRTHASASDCRDAASASRSL